MGPQFGQRRTLFVKLLKCSIVEELKFVARVTENARLPQGCFRAFVTTSRVHI